MSQPATLVTLVEPVHKSVVAPPAEKRNALLSPGLDALMIGGASLLLFLFAQLYLDKDANVAQVSWTAYYLAWAVNHPHFMASYVLLYWDKRRELIDRPAYFWAAFLMPSLLFLYFLYAIVRARSELLGYAVNAMFFLVGWHYVKQIYGTVIVSSALKGYYFSKAEAWALKLAMIPVWMMSFLNANTAIREQMHYGIAYQTLALPEWAPPFNYALLTISLLVLGGLLARKWAREGKMPGLSASCSFAAIYVWYLPQAYHPHFWYLIPLFHSLQYMLFVMALKRGQYASEVVARTAVDPDQIEAARWLQARKFVGFFVLITVLGMATFIWIPAALNRVWDYDRALFGPQLFSFLFITFINIHHYFIDNVIWRRDNPALKFLV